MNLNEKIKNIEELTNRQNEYKIQYFEADKSKNSDEKKRLSREVKEIDKQIEKIKSDYKKERETRVIDEKIAKSASEFLTKGQEIKNSIEENTNRLNEPDISEEEKAEAQKNIDKLNEQNEKLKNDIYDRAMQKSGLTWKDKKIYPSDEIKKEKENLENLEKEKEALEEQRKKQTEVVERDKEEMNVQYEAAIEKYRQLLEAGKITQELFEDRVQNMMYAKEKDTSSLDKSLEDLNNSIDSKNSEIDKVKTKISDLEEKEKIFDEYNNVYYELFGETLDAYYIANKDRLEPKEPKEPKIENKEKVNTPEENKNKKEKARKDPVDNFIPNSQVVNQMPQQMQVPPAEPELSIAKENHDDSRIFHDEEKDRDVVVTSKSSFNELYAKLNKGTINDKEINALLKVLEDKDNYDKYGITTGIVFNKARKILKYTSGKTFKNIESFLKKSSEFSNDIKFDTSIEKEDDVCSHEILNYWEEIQEDYMFSNYSLSVEKYIEKIEAYKDAGNELTEKQQKMYDEAMIVKSNVTSYRKALDTSGEVSMERDAKSHNSVFYNLFKSKSSTKALPTAEEQRDNNVIVIENQFGLELDSMVNHEAHEETPEKSNSEPEIERENEENIK